MGIYGADEDDIVEHGARPIRAPRWARRPRWLPALDWQPSRAAAILGLAGLLIGLSAGYALGYRQLGRAVLPSRMAGAGAQPSAGPGPATPSGPAGTAAGFGAYSSGLSILQFSDTDLAQTGRTCSVQHGNQLQVGVEVINLSAAVVILGKAKVTLPLGGLRALSEQWAACGAIAQPGDQGGQGTIAIINGAAGEAGSGGTPGSEYIVPPGGDIVPPGGAAWLSVTLRVLEACPGPLPVQFSVSYQENGKNGTARLPGFPDLGDVPYTGCKGESSLGGGPLDAHPRAINQSAAAGAAVGSSRWTRPTSVTRCGFVAYR